MGEVKEEFLSKAYGLEGAEATQGFYAGWAETYEEEVRCNGYATPARCAAALISAGADKTAPLLDLGCGTGLSGEAFREAGFSIIDGTDFSEPMLAFAGRKPGLYRKLTLGDLNNPIPAEPGEYANIAAVGVFSPGHAPAATIDKVLALLPKGGCFVFSLNDHAMQDRSYQGRVCELVDTGWAELLHKEYGPHLPGIGMKSTIYVIRRR
jgi:predicted TPR repeat methyltransferase